MEAGLRVCGDGGAGSERRNETEPLSTEAGNDRDSEHCPGTPSGHPSAPDQPGSKCCSPGSISGVLFICQVMDQGPL